MRKRLSTSEILELACDDIKILATLDDLIRAILFNGRNERSGQHLLDVIEFRLGTIACREVEEESNEAWEELA